jgi:putative nucleotidyltransferase with HDIG domain
MGGLTISRDSGTRLASYIEARRRDIVASVIRSSFLARPGSIAASVFAGAFLDRLLQELEVGDHDVVDVWADAQSGPGDAAEHARIVVMALAVISTTYAADCGHSDEIVSYLAQRSGELERRFRSDGSAGGLRPTESAKLVSRDEIVASLLSAIDARDTATCDHSRAVGMWCGRIAKTMGMGPDEQAFAALAGTLHDIGKIATPTEILLKAGPLDPGEWETMRSHSAIGAKMLERIPSLKELAPVVRAHHERMDGRGYPDGLRGSAIPVAARIVSVADSFHAMISKRPYRQPMPVPAALDELRAGTGTQWDPEVAQAMLTIVAPAGMTRVRHAASGTG